MTYKDLPVHIYPTSFDFGSNLLLAENVSVDASASLAPNINKKEYRPEAPPQNKISIQTLLSTQNESGYLWADDSNNSNGGRSFTVEIGGNVYEDCYLNQYNIDIEPFQPVRVSVEFSTYTPPTGESISGSADDNSFVYNGNEVVYGHTCQLIGSLGPSTYTKISYTKRYDRTPVYTLGSIAPSNQLINGIQEEMSVESTGLDSLVSFSGNKIEADFRVWMKDVSADDNSYLPNVIMPSGSIIDQQLISSQAGGSLVTNTTLKNIVL